MYSAATYRQNVAVVAGARARACVTTPAPWSIAPFSGMHLDHKPGPRLPASP